MPVSSLQPQRVEKCPRILAYIGILIWPIDVAEGVSGEEGAELEVAVAHALVEGAPFVLVFGVGLLAVVVGAFFGSAGAEGFVGGLPGDVAAGVGLTDDIAT